VSHRFIQIHFLSSYPAALLNRDDVGFAKRLPFGGVTRTRISSQCLKRHWRTFDGEDALRHLEADGEPVEMSIRSRRTFERFILAPLLEDGVDPELAAAVVEALMRKVLGDSAKAKATRDEGTEDAQGPQVRTGQITILGRPEIDFLLGEAREICAMLESPKEAKKAVDERFKKEAGKNLSALKRAAGLDAALFGRMVTSDLLARGDAAVHVAHAFTVHGESAETDYFTAVDDLLSDGPDAEMGSGHIGTTELTSGLYYGYAVVDVPLLVSNLEGTEAEDWESADRALAGEVVDRLIRMIATVSPGAKKGSTAPYTYAHWLAVEAGSAQPRTLANAFLAPVAERSDVVRNTYRALRGHLEDLDGMYGRRTVRRWAGIGPVDELSEGPLAEGRGSLDEVARWAAGAVRGADD
jgi:CRISPR system Cascade subunit CasC